MRQTTNRIEAVRERRRRGEASVVSIAPSIKPSRGGESKRASAPTLILFSADRELTALVKKTARAPWKIEVCEDPAIGPEALSRPSVRLVIVDDGAVDEEARGWLLDRIRKFVPQALLIYVASAHSEADEKRARRYAAQYYIAKPLDMGRTSRVIESFIRAAAERDGAAEGSLAPR